MQDCKEENMELISQVNGHENRVLAIDDPVIKKLGLLFERMDEMQRDQAMLFFVTVFSGLASPLALLKTDGYRSQVSQSMCTTNEILLVILWGITLYLAFIEKEIKITTRDYNICMTEYEDTVEYDKLVFRFFLLILGIFFDYKFQPILENTFPIPYSFFDKMLLGIAGPLLFSPSAFLIPCFLIVEDLSHTKEPLQEEIMAVATQPEADR